MNGSEWRADYASAEDQLLRAGLAATPDQRLAWLEEALLFAYEAGALTAAVGDAVAAHGAERPSGT